MTEQQKPIEVHVILTETITRVVKWEYEPYEEGDEPDLKKIRQEVADARNTGDLSDRSAYVIAAYAEATEAWVKDAPCNVVDRGTYRWCADHDDGIRDGQTQCWRVQEADEHLPSWE